MTKPINIRAGSLRGLVYNLDTLIDRMRDETDIMHRLIISGDAEVWIVTDKHVAFYDYAIKHHLDEYLKRQADTDNASNETD